MISLVHSPPAPTLAPMARKKSVPPTGERTGDRIRRFRLAQGLTQIELGRRVGLSSRMMAYYEVQGGEPRPELLVKMAQVLGVSVDSLTGRQEPSRRPPVQAEELSLWRRLKRVQELPPHDRKAILKMIDALADRSGRRKAS